MLAIAGEPFNGAFNVAGDEGRLGQVLTNLIDNAISFSPDGGTVTVTARVAAPFVEILVEDEGPGIPEDRLEIIFDRFYSDRPATRHQPRQELGSRAEHFARDRPGARRRDHRRESLRRRPNSRVPSRAAHASRCGCRLPVGRNAEERRVADAPEPHTTHGTAIAVAAARR